MASTSKKKKKTKKQLEAEERKKQLLIAQNRLKNLKGSKGQIKVGGDMESTLKRLGISAADLLKIKA
jgi:hypothetical protein